jgi:hypothetical protein
MFFPGLFYELLYLRYILLFGIDTGIRLAALRGAATDHGGQQALCQVP